MSDDETRNDSPRRAGHASGQRIFMIGGPAGAGKTTLLKRLLAHEMDRGRRPAVLVHEAGEANVNTLLLEEEGGPRRRFDLHVLRTNCSCCDPRPTLASLLQRVLRSAGEDVFIEAGLIGSRQLVETVETVLAREGRSRAAHLLSVIAVLDAGRLVRSRVLDIASREDVAAADTVVLNKSDLIDDRDVAQLVLRVRAASPRARVVTAAHGSVPPARLLRGGPPRPRNWPTPSASASMTGGFVSATAQLLGPVVVPRLQRLLARSRRDLVRVKGFMRTKGAPGLHELHWVPDTLELRPRRSSWGIRAELVLVGHQQIDWERLATELDRCVDVEPTETLNEAAV